MADETLHYVVTYKWGVIHKEAATATLSLRNSGDNYRLTLTARTKPWADPLFQVRDTLTATLSKASLQPLRYVKSAHEGGKFSRDDIRFSYAGSQVTGQVKRIREDKKGKRSESELTLRANGKTFDMLSVFYFLRTVDYRQLLNGQSVTANIFSGKQTETLTIRCSGKERIEMYGKTKIHKEAWHIKFRFTSHGGKKSSDDIDAWISTDPSHLPLKVVGSLPIGQVRVYLTSPL